MNQRIIAVDDSDIAQEFIRINLAELGFNDVVGFMSPREALSSFEKGPASADLILLDIMMPEMDGIELCARIRVIDAWRDIPIIMLTSRMDIESLSRAFMAGANDYVTKPFNRIELQARMRSCLRLKSEMDRRRAGERRGSRTTASTLTADVSPHVRDVVGTKASLQADFLSMNAETRAMTGMVVLKIDDIKPENDLQASQAADVIRQVSKTVAKVAIPAGDSFVHWDNDLFCLAATGATVGELESRAKVFIDAVDAAALTLTDTWSKTQVTLSAAIAPANGGTLANNLAQAIQAVNAASRDRLSSLVTVVNEQDQH
ncbi:response regulator [Falsihalocynthiibacter arcticus]|nr:response regulator [Falsihalocynthiibacter arcticus]